MISVRRLPRGAVGYERLPNAAIRNAGLSLAAVGLLARLLADGEQYESIDALADAYSRTEAGEKRARGRGRDAYRKAATELEAAGYLVRTDQPQAGKRVRTAVTAVPANTEFIPGTAEPSRQRPAETVPSEDQGQGESLALEALTCGDSASSQVGPGTVQPSRLPTAEAVISPAHPHDGSAVAGMGWGNDPSEHVSPGTDMPSRPRPAERSVSADHSRDGSAVPGLYIQTSVQTSDLPPASAQDAAERGPQAPQEEGGERQGEETPAAAATELLDRIDFGRPLRGGERERLAGLVADALGLGWPADKLLADLNREWDGSRSRVAVAHTRLTELGPPPPQRPARATAKLPALPPPEAVVRTEDVAGWREARKALSERRGEPYRLPEAEDTSGESAAGAVGDGDAGKPPRRPVDAPTLRGPLEFSDVFRRID